MLNIISLSAMRERVTGPGKVVKNLMKGLDLLGYPYVINANLNSTKRLWIHDDIGALSFLKKLNKEIKPIIGPNMFSLPRNISSNLELEYIPYIMPCQWITYLWKDFGYKGILDIWPVGIDTDSFISNIVNKKNEVLVYLKKRFPGEKELVTRILNEKGIRHTCIEYGVYQEQDFKNALSHAKYVIWVGCPETQGIALEEILASDVPILVWDVQFLGQWNPTSNRDVDAFTQKELLYHPVTSAEYFNETCGRKIYTPGELSETISFMEQNFMKFSPRKFILENLSLTRQARAFIELYNIHYGLTFNDGVNEKSASGTIKSFHNQWLWKNIFRIYDSKTISYIRRLIQ